MLGEPEVEDKLVVAVDFGTTFSGVATVYSANPDDLDIIKVTCLALSTQDLQLILSTELARWQRHYKRQGPN